MKQQTFVVVVIKLFMKEKSFEFDESDDCVMNESKENTISERKES